MVKSSKKRLPPRQKEIRSIPRWGIDHPGIVPSIPKIKPVDWGLSVEGEVETPLRLSWKEFLALPKVEILSDFHCVEGWSVLDCKWSGVSFKILVEMVKPNESAK